MAELTDEIIAELKRQYGDVYRLDACEKTIVVKAPTRPIYKKFRNYGADDERRSVALQSLVDDTVVWPSRAEYDAMLEVLPGLSETFGGEVARLAGLTRVVDSKKL